CAIFGMERNTGRFDAICSARRRRPAAPIAACGGACRQEKQLLATLIHRAQSTERIAVDQPRTQLCRRDSSRLAPIRTRLRCRRTRAAAVLITPVCAENFVRLIW